MDGGGGYSGGGGGGGGGKSRITSLVDDGSVVSRSVKSHTYYLARRTVLAMLNDRGCIVSEAEMTLSLSDFLSAYGQKPNPDRLRVCVSLRSNPSKKILVIFCGTDEITKKTMAGILTQIVDKDSLHQVILILQSKITYHARKIAEEYSVEVEIFQITDLSTVHITKHVQMQKTEVLTAEEKEKLLKKYNIEDKQIPQILLETDATSSYYGLENGQVVKVTHNVAVLDDLNRVRLQLASSRGKF